MKTQMKVSTSLQQTELSYKSQVIQLIKEVVCIYYGVDHSIYKSKDRKLNTIKVKHNAIFLCLQNVKVSYAMMGGFFDCDHATILHIQKKIYGHLSWDYELKKELNEIQTMIINKGKFVDGKMTLGENYYYLDMSNFTSMVLADKKGIIFVGIPEKEMLEIRNKFNKSTKLINFDKTGMYILKKLEEENKTQ